MLHAQKAFRNVPISGIISEDILELFQFYWQIPVKKENNWQVSIEKTKNRFSYKIECHVKRTLIFNEDYIRILNQ
jgi:hypothetical protein